MKVLPRLLSVVMLMTVGCNEAEETDLVPVHPVSGQVKFQGKPMAHAVITFVPASDSLVIGSSRPHATADEDGRYELTTISPGDGAPIGDYKVTIYWPETWSEDADPLPPDRLGNAYADADSTSLTAKVQTGVNEKNFDLK